MAPTEKGTPQWQSYLSKTSNRRTDSHSRLTATSKNDRIFNDDMDEGTRPRMRRKFNLELSPKSRDVLTLQQQIVPYYPHNLRQYVVLPIVETMESALRVNIKKFSIDKPSQISVAMLDLGGTIVVSCRCSLTLWCYNTGAHHKQLVCRLTKFLPLQIARDRFKDQAFEFVSSDAFFDVSSGVLGTYRRTPEGRVYALADQYSIIISIEPQDNLESWPLINLSTLESYGPVTRAIKYGCASEMDVMLHCKTVIKAENQELSAPISASCGSLSCGNNAKGCHGEEQNTQSTLEIHTRWSRSIVGSKAKGKPLKHYVERWAQKEAAIGVLSFQSSTEKIPEETSIRMASSSSRTDSGHSTLITSEDSRQFNFGFDIKRPLLIPSTNTESSHQSPVATNAASSKQHILAVPCVEKKAPLKVPPVVDRRFESSINTLSSDQSPIVSHGAPPIQYIPAVPCPLWNRPHVPPPPVQIGFKRKIPHTSKPLFHTITKQRLYPGDDLPDTDDETEEHWLSHKHQDIVGDYTDLNEFEKEYIKKWNVFITREQHTVPNFLAQAMRRFVDANDTWISEKRFRQREWTKHCTYLIMRRVMTEQEFSTCVDVLDHSRVGTSSIQKSVVESTRPRGRLECGAYCLQKDLPRGRVVHPTEGITCHGEKCPQKFYHRPCAMLSGRDLENWFCDLCLYDMGRWKLKTMLKD
ncbi:hypothetical protein BJ875DRAFT_457298 [Amylocarpus encephaloides]|uniref:Polycomb protein VEFS-Box domain-containing protein n=1 Tax=Amylocarpus encephaloides TaxID=45428 RepID=A0A9P8C6W2_9HELO|nr:hypothetical protein BJ875DRAFT_457298 [Amylocarpus encephaloides]